MANDHSSMMEPPIEDLLAHVDSKFTLVTLAAKRGRQINSYFNQLGEGLGAIVPPQVASTSRKPLSIALEEVSAGKVTFIRNEPSEAVAEVAPIVGEGVSAASDVSAANDGSDARDVSAASDVVETAADPFDAALAAEVTDVSTE